MKQNKLKNSINRSSIKLDNINTNNIIKNKNDNDNDYPNRLLYIEGGPYVIESYARRSLGPWLRYEDIYIDNTMNSIIKNVIEGGCEEDIYRSDLDTYLALKIYGIGMGGEVQVINKIKGIIPKLRKVRSKDFEFGYRLALPDEGINILKRSMTKLPEYKKKPLIPASRINIQSIIDNMKNTISKGDNDNNDNGDDLKAILSSYINRINDSIYNINDLCIFTDGSALLHGNNCADASAAVVVLPLLYKDDANDDDKSTRGIGYKSDNNINTIAVTDYALRIRVSNIGGIVTTPFDAELSAGLFAVTIANLMLSLVNTDKITIMTDSRSLCKAIRTTPSSNDNNTNESRYILWTLLLKLYNKISDVDVKWIPGHPERRNSDRNYWSGYDVGIWEADKVAQILRDSNDSKSSDSIKINIDKDINGIDMLKICSYMFIN